MEWEGTCDFQRGSGGSPWTCFRSGPFASPTGQHIRGVKEGCLFTCAHMGTLFADSWTRTIMAPREPSHGNASYKPSEGQRQESFQRPGVSRFRGCGPEGRGVQEKGSDLFAGRSRSECFIHSKRQGQAFGSQ